MRIFDEILTQYMQVASKNRQYKMNIQSLSRSNIKNVVNDTTNLKTYSNNYNTIIKTLIPQYDNQSINVKEVYNKLEIDARRYNRNFDSQTGAVTL